MCWQAEDARAYVHDKLRRCKRWGHVMVGDNYLVSIMHIDPPSWLPFSRPKPYPTPYQATYLTPYPATYPTPYPATYPTPYPVQYFLSHFSNPVYQLLYSIFLAIFPTPCTNYSTVHYFLIHFSIHSSFFLLLYLYFSRILSFLFPTWSLFTIERPLSAIHRWTIVLVVGWSCHGSLHAEIDHVATVGGGRKPLLTNHSELFVFTAYVHCTV